MCIVSWCTSHPTKLQAIGTINDNGNDLPNTAAAVSAKDPNDDNNAKPEEDPIVSAKTRKATM